MRVLNPARIITLISLYFTFTLLLLGCSSTGNTCRRPLPLTWSNQTLLLEDVTRLSSPAFAGRKTMTPGAALTRDYLILRMQQAGLVPWSSSLAPLTMAPAKHHNPFEQHFSYQYQFTERQGVNLIGMLPATHASSQWRLIVAHYDHLGMRGSKLYPGADDNASGIAAMLALAEHAKSQQRPTNLLFIATDAEEQGLYGSQALVAMLQDNNSQPSMSQIELAINLDMVGRPDRYHTIYLEGRRNFSQFAALQQHLMQTVGLCIRANHPPEAGKTIQRIDWLRSSDHYSFHQAKLPWLYFGIPPHSDYHQTSDIASKIDIEFLAAVTETAYELLIIDSYLLNNRAKQ
ncbi:M20/M25/M40 family metallo-hydrolase [Shewanella algidipiscicola]|uniref:M20/M25/M40 family metallo-hydrolase n=1 Tax=Shewanella algidipiscicola TaxID=614070 RepID=UPI000D789F9D|nr:M20/M25/M40 family metallo-hydrolase [Shewanella algidipiscicola]